MWFYVGDVGGETVDAVVDGDGLGDLEEADQFQRVQALGAGLVL